MPKPSVPEKMLELSKLYFDRLEKNLRAERPEVTLYWATMIHSLFTLAQGMTADGQMHLEVLGELNTHNSRAMGVIRQLAPQELEGLGGVTDKRCMAYMLDAYEDFREEGERIGVL